MQQGYVESRAYVAGQGLSSSGSRAWSKSKCRGSQCRVVISKRHACPDCEGAAGAMRSRAHEARHHRLPAVAAFRPHDLVRLARREEAAAWRVASAWRTKACGWCGSSLLESWGLLPMNAALWIVFARNLMLWRGQA